MNILITGGSKGIGKAIATELAARGHHLCLVAREHEHLVETAKTLTDQHNVPVIVKTADISQPESVRSIKNFCQEKNFTPDVLILNAGIWLAGSLDTTTPADFSTMMETNVGAAFSFIREFVPMMKALPYGRIILTGSTAGIEPTHRHGGSLYSVTKWAIHGLAVNLRQELLMTNIGVTHIAPGSVATPMWDPEEIQADRMLAATDIAKLVAATLDLSPQAVVEEIVVRPQHGNI